MSHFTTRPEREGEEAAIAQVITSAFAGRRYSNGREAEVAARLRDALDLEASWVAATAADEIIGYVAFSMVRIDGEECGWFGIGPVAVVPERQGEGIGSALVETGLAVLQAEGAAGCVVLGDPGFYSRFGFVHDPGLAYPGPPPEHFQRLLWRGEAPRGTVSYAPAFG